ncbi:MAG TPA: glycosyltransferase family 2 protein [Terracidiphilus sp.]|nr:glycosyltransferase family 2 protein [Terracidiphilus sp.]
MVSIVVPVYNEEDLIIQFHEAVSSVLRTTSESWEVVYVNDGSTDSTLEQLKSTQALDPHVVVVELSRNWGQMGAIFAGLRTARGRAVILMDADFQDPPEVVPQLIDAWRGGAEVVTAVRRSRQERRRVLAFLFPLFYRVLGAISDYPMSLNAGLFGLMDRKAVDSILAMGEQNPYLPGLRAWVGYRNTLVYYDRQDRLGGEGKLSFISRIKYATDAIMSFSYKPIRLSFLLCCVATIVAFLLGAGALIASTPIKAAALGVGCAIFLVGGLMLIAIGVLGEYIVRIFDQVRGRPLSLISQVYRAPAELAAQAGVRSLQNGSYAVQSEVYSSKAKSCAA